MVLVYEPMKVCLLALLRSSVCPVTVLSMYERHCDARNTRLLVVPAEKKWYIDEHDTQTWLAAQVRLSLW